MTLVVARVTPLGVRIAADMRITHPWEIQRGFLRAALKIILLNPTLCVAYGGNVGPALDAIRRISAEGLDIETASAQLLDAHVRSDPPSDFLVAGLRPSRLVAIKDGRVEDCEAGWLGDTEAFEEYQRYYHDAEQLQPPPEFYDSAERAADIEIANHMSRGMEAVVHGAAVKIDGDRRTVALPRGGSHDSVGEAIVNVVPRVEDNLFKYAEYNRANASPFSEPLPAHGGVVPPDFGSAERGAFSYFMLTPVEPGVGAIGIYFEEGRLGVLYAPLVLDEPERYPSISMGEFVNLVQERRGVSLHGFIGDATA